MVICSTCSGVSWSAPAAKIAPTIEPADVPETRWIAYPASISATTAPARPMPLTPPPDRTRSAFSAVERANGSLVTSEL